jgi:hypothetical protein
MAIIILVIAIDLELVNDEWEVDSTLLKLELISC